MEPITIKKVSISSGFGLKVAYTQKEADGSLTSINRDCSSPVHDDMTDAFDKLSVHLGCISDFIDPDDINNIEKPKHAMLNDFKVRGIDIEDDDTGVRLEGTKKLKSGKKLSLKTPTVKWGDKKPYDYAGNLSEIVESIKYEVDQYLFHAKHAPDQQLKLFDENGNPEIGDENEMPVDDDGIMDVAVESDDDDEFGIGDE